MMIGLDAPGPGISVFHPRFALGDQLEGNESESVATPLPNWPRNRGQSSADTLKLEMVIAANAMNKAGDRIIGSSHSVEGVKKLASLYHKRVAIARSGRSRFDGWSSGSWLKSTIRSAVSAEVSGLSVCY